MVATRHETRLTMHDKMHMPRSHGAASGLLVVLLGIWGGLIPFIGPMFGYAFSPDVSWHWTWGRFLLEVLPAIATVIGGLIMMGTAHRASGSFGAWLAAAGGAWFVLGQWFSMLWNNGVMQAGTPTAASNLGQVVEWVGFFLGLGVAIVFLAAFALGRMSVVDLKATERAERRLAAREAERSDVEPTATGHTSTTGRRVRDENVGDETGR